MYSLNGQGKQLNPVLPAETKQFEPHSSPFDLSHTDAYTLWRTRKLREYPAQLGDLVVQINNPLRLDTTEHSALISRIDRSNMAVFTAAQKMSKTELLQFCAQLGLKHLDKNLCADDDGISELQVIPNGRAHEYIPYSNKPINWHTDGYYNAPNQLIRAMVLYCIRPAAQGGANALLDPELVYLWLRDINPNFIAALMHPQCMTIPPNIENGVEIRAAQSGPVFSIDSGGGLHMRYTARTRSIEWRNDATTRAAVAQLERLLCTDSPCVFTHRLEAGQGLISNNILHTRTAFTDGTTIESQRLMYRARYYDRVHATLFSNDSPR